MLQRRLREARRVTAATDEYSSGRDRVLIQLLLREDSGVVRIRPGDTYYVDKAGAVLVGWHGTYDPLCDMGGYAMIEKYVSESGSPIVYCEE